MNFAKVASFLEKVDNKLPWITINPRRDFETFCIQNFDIHFSAVDYEAPCQIWKESDYFKVGLMPDFCSVSELLQSHPRIKGNCNLLLFWQLPYHNSTDIEAIGQLHPKTIVAAYEQTGLYGSYGFHSWLQWIGGPTSSIHQPERFPTIYPYKVVEKFESVYQNCMFPACILAERVK